MPTNDTFTFIAGRPGYDDSIMPVRGADWGTDESLIRLPLGETAPEKLEVVGSQEGIPAIMAPAPAPAAVPGGAPVVDAATIQRVAADVVKNNPDKTPEEQKAIALQSVNKLLEAQKPYVETGQKFLATATVFTGILALLGKVGEKTKSVFLKVKGMRGAQA